MSTTARQTRAFTLIEILVVVAIIALLISVLLPSLNRAKAQAKSVVCQTNLKQITTGMFMYRMDFRGYVPRHLWSEERWNVDKKELWFYTLYPKYVRDPNVYFCPADPFRGQANFNAPTRRRNFDILHDNTTVPSCGYGMNYLIRHMGTAGTGDKSFDIEHKGPRKRLQNNILLAEVGPDDQLRKQTFNYPAGVGYPWRDGGRIIWDDGFRGWFSGPTWLTTRHYGGINIAAMDGSILRAPTKHLLDGSQPIAKSYPNCKLGDCYFCVRDPQPHYNFAHVKMYWWTGTVPQ